MIDKTNVKAFYKLSAKRQEIEGEIEMNNFQIKELQNEGKKYKKGSDERKDYIKKADDIKNSCAYRELKAELKIMNFCINTVFYG